MYGVYADKIVEMAQNTFVPIYQSISRQYWNNSVFAHVKRPHYMCNFEDAIAEYYIPTTVDEENFMLYHRVVISVHSELDMDTIRSEVRRLKTPFVRPMGFIDSETIFFVAPKVSKKQIENLKRNGKKAIMRAFRHEQKRGYLTAIIINNVPEIAFKKIVEILRNFWQNRLSKLLSKLNIQPYHLSYKIGILFSITSKIHNLVIEKLGLKFRTMIDNFNDLVCYFTERLKAVKREIGLQNVLKSAIKLLNEVENEEDRVKLIKQMAQIYCINLQKITR